VQGYPFFTSIQVLVSNVSFCYRAENLLPPPNGWFQRQRRDEQDTFAHNLRRWLAAHTPKRRSRCPLQTLVGRIFSFERLAWAYIKRIPARVFNKPVRSRTTVTVTVLEVML